MKIGIITQPLHQNYGGLLQNFALQKVLQKLGHDTHTIKRNNTRRWYKTLIIDTLILLRRLIKNNYSLPLHRERAKITKNCTEFVKNNITTTKKYYNRQEFLDIIEKHHFDAFVVGSDQVWRPCYSTNIYDDFLTFCQNKKNIKRLAYAASFGVTDWEFNEEQTKECSRLAKLFDAISVREDSGVELCNKNLGVEATFVLDPTLLLEKDDYIKLVEQNNEEKSKGELFCYILDTNPLIEKSIKNIEQKTSFKSFQVKAKYNINSIKKNCNINARNHFVGDGTM